MNETFDQIMKYTHWKQHCGGQIIPCVNVPEIIDDEFLHARRLKKLITRFQTEHVEAYEAGQSMEILLQHIQVDDGHGTLDILDMGKKLKSKPNKQGPALIDITMDSSC